MGELAVEHEIVLLAALNDNPEWQFMVTCAAITDQGPAIVYAKRSIMPTNEDERLTEFYAMVTEMKLKAAMSGLVLSALPFALWEAGWAKLGADASPLVIA